MRTSGRPLFYQHFNSVVPDLVAVKAQYAEELEFDPEDIVLVKDRGACCGSSDDCSDGHGSEDRCGCDGAAPSGSV